MELTQRKTKWFNNHLKFMKNIGYMRELKNKENLIILPADKGDTTAVMNTNDCIKRMTDILEDDCYISSARDPTMKNVQTGRKFRIE